MLTEEDDLIAAVTAGPASEPAVDDEALVAAVTKEPEPVRLGDVGFRHLSNADIAGLQARGARKRGADEVSLGKADIPFVGPIWGEQEIKRALEAEARMRGGTATREDELLVLDAAIEAQRDTTFGNKVAELGKSFATGGAEIGLGFAAGGPAGAAASALRRKAVSAGTRAFLRVATGAGVAIAGPEALPRVFGANGGRWRLESLQRALPELDGKLTPEQWQELEHLSDTTFPEWLEAEAPLWKGLVNQSIEVATELVGWVLGKIPLVAGARALQARAMAHVLRTAPDGIEAGMKALSRGVGIDDIASEMIEERLATAAKAAVPGFEETFADVIPGAKEALAEFVAFSIPGLGVTAQQRVRERVRAAFAARKAEQQGRGPGGADGPAAAAETPAPEGGDPQQVAPEPDAPPSGEGATALAASPRGAGDAATPATEGVPSSRPLPEVEDPEAGPVRGALSGSPILAAAQGQAAQTQGSIGRGLRGTLEPTTDRVTNPVRIMDALSEVVQSAGGKTPIRSGRVRAKWAAGHFDVKQETIELLRSNDIAVASHEVAHAIEKHIFGWTPKANPWDIGGAAGIDAAAQRELQALGKALYGSQKPAGGYRREGWAEYVKLWTMEGGAQNTPALDAWFKGTFLPKHPEVAAKLETVRDLAEVWRSQGSVNRGREMIVPEESLPEKLRGLRRAVTSGQFSAAVYDRFVDELGPLKRATQEAEATFGSPIPTAKDPFELASAWRLSAPARARYMAEHGMIDLAGNVTGPALIEVKPLVAGRYQDFVTYLYARRAKALIEDPQGARDPGISIQDANQIIAELGSPEFAKAADIVYGWNDGLLTYMAQASPTMARVVDSIRKRDPGAYVPLQREFEQIRQGLAGKGGSVKSGSVSKRLKGSGRRIKDPLPQMLEAAEKRISQAHERAILEAVLEFRKIEGMGHLIEEVPPDKVLGAQQGIGRVIEAIEREAKKAQAATGKTPTGLFSAGLMQQEIVQAGLDPADPLKFFDESFRPTKADETPVIPVMDQGRLRYFRIGDPALYKALEGLDVYRLPKFFDIVFGVPKRLLTTTVTSLSPAFGLWSNPARDFQQFMVNTSIANPAEAAAGWGAMVAKSALTAGTFGKVRSVELDMMERLGVSMARRLAADSAPTRRAARRLAGHRVIDAQTPGDVLDVVRDILQFTENAPREAEMLAVAKATGWAPGMPMSLEQSIKVGLAGKRVTTDFSAAGKWAKVANQAIPFFNVAIQGPRAVLRAAKDHPARFVGVGVTMMTIPAVALWLMQSDEEWYQEMTDEERYGYFWFRVGNELYGVPRSHELGFGFATLPEMLLNRWKQDDPEGAEGWARSLIGYTGEATSEAWRVLAPDVLPVPVGWAAEQLANRSFFFDTPVVSRGLEDVPVEEQFNDYTSRASIAIGEALGLSPMRVEHTIKYLTGTVGSEFLKMTGRGADDIEIEPELADLAVIGRIARRGGVVGTHSRSVEEVFDITHDANVRSRSKKRPETAEQRDERLLLKNATAAIAAISHTRAITSDAEARRKLSLEATRIAQDALKAVSSGAALRERWRFQAAEREREAAEKTAEAELARRRAAKQ